MIRKAKESIDIVSFYWTLRGIDVVEDPSAVQVGAVFILSSSSTFFLWKF